MYGGSGSDLYTGKLSKKTANAFYITALIFLWLTIMTSAGAYGGLTWNNVVLTRIDPEPNFILTVVDNTCSVLYVMIADGILVRGALSPLYLLCFPVQGTNPGNFLIYRYGAAWFFGTITNGFYLSWASFSVRLLVRRA